MERRRRGRQEEVGEDRLVSVCARVEQTVEIYCAQKETHIFNVAISNELFD